MMYVSFLSLFRLFVFIFSHRAGLFAIEISHHQVHVRISPASSSNSSPPAKTCLNNPQDDPTIIPLVKHVDYDTHTMHVMQTLLFQMPEEAAALKALQQVPKQMNTVQLDISA